VSGELSEIKCKVCGHMNDACITSFHVENSFGYDECMFLLQCDRCRAFSIVTWEDSWYDGGHLYYDGPYTREQAETLFLFFFACPDRSLKDCPCEFHEAVRDWIYRSTRSVFDRQDLLDKVKASPDYPEWLKRWKRALLPELPPAEQAPQQAAPQAPCEPTAPEAPRIPCGQCGHLNNAGLAAFQLDSIAGDDETHHLLQCEACRALSLASWQPDSDAEGGGHWSHRGPFTPTQAEAIFIFFSACGKGARCPCEIHEAVRDWLDLGHARFIPVFDRADLLGKLAADPRHAAWQAEWSRVVLPPTSQD